MRIEFMFLSHENFVGFLFGDLKNAGDFFCKVTAIKIFG